MRIDLLHAAPELKWVWHPCSKKNFCWLILPFFHTGAEIKKKREENELLFTAYWMASRSRWPSRCYIFMVLTIFRTGKSGHLLHWPDHWLIGGPLPNDCCSPCLCHCHLVPILVRHGGRSMLPWLHSVYARLLVLSSINSLAGSVLKNCSTTTSIGTSLLWGSCFVFCGR